MPGTSILGNTIDIIEGVPAVDLQTAANNGDYISMKNNAAVLILFVSGVGTAGDDPTLTIQQATDACGTSAKALNIVTSPVKAWKKQAATSLASTTSWTDASCCVSTNTLTNATSAEQSAMWAVEYDAGDLDVSNGFDYIRATVADIGSNAQPGWLGYVVKPAYRTDPDNTVSSIC
jgi:hypothetical protein